MKRAVIALIRLYQRTISPDHGALPRGKYVGCRYYPSCSEYTARSVEHYGVVRGLARGVWRVLRCNPFSQGGVDEPVPSSPSKQQTVKD